MDNSIILPWTNLINLIHWQSQQRFSPECNSLDISSSLNISIIVSCCSIVEGYLFTTIKDHIYIVDTKTNPKVVIRGIQMIPLEDKKYEFIKRILNDFTDQLLQGKWSNYVKLFEVLTGENIKKIVPPIYNEAIKMLFQLRNQLVHGNEIEFEEIMDKDSGKMIYKPSGKYKEVVDYLSKQKPKLDLLKRNRIDLLSNCVANYFYTKMVDFIKELNGKIDNSQRTILTEDLYVLLNGKIDYKF